MPARLRLTSANGAKLTSSMTLTTSASGPDPDLTYGALKGRERNASEADSRHHLAVKVPSGVPEHGNDDNETKERGY
jgi:hypothetical protein